MADRQDSDREVLTSLPRSRPVRRSAKRGDRPKAPATASAAKADPRKAAAAKPRPASNARPAAKARRTAAPEPGAVAPRPEDPRAEPERKVPPAGYAAPTGQRESADADTGSAASDLVGTTIQAAAELAQIGLELGRQTLRSMLDRLPKP